MDIAEHRLPQDGRFSVHVGKRRLDLRSSTYPTMHGEKAVLRLLDRSTLRLQLEAMGMRGTVARSLPRSDSPARGHDPDHRPDGQRQDVDALRRRWRRSSRPASTSSPSRIRSSTQLPGRQSGTDQREGRLHVRARAARDSAAGPGRHHGRRDSRSGDAADRGRGVAHRSPGVLDAPHQQRHRHGRAPRRHGPRALPARVEHARHRGAAAGAPHLRHLSRESADAAGRGAPLRRGRAGFALSRAGLPRLPRHRLSRPRRHPRARRRSTRSCDT